MLENVFVKGCGAYVPKFRIAAEEIAKMWGGGSPGVKEKTVPDMDEDVITMAVGAGQNALKECGIDSEKIGYLAIASVSSPYIQKSVAAEVALPLGVPETATMLDLGGSTVAGTRALIACHDAIRAGRAQFGMVIASDNLSGIGMPGDPLEFTYGAGAAAIVLCTQEGIAKIGGITGISTGFVNTWRADGDRFVQRYDDPRFEREYGCGPHIQKAAKLLVEKLGIQLKEIHHIALHEQDGRLPQAIAKSLGMKWHMERAIAPYCGDTGCSSPFLGLLSNLGEGKIGDKILLVSYGSGAGSDAMIFEITEETRSPKNGVLSLKEQIAQKENIDYLTYQKLIGIVKRPFPLRDPMSSFPAGPAFWREREYLVGLKGLKCTKCGSINFPKRDYCVDCRNDRFEAIRLPRRGEIVTYNIQHVLAMAPEEAPVVVCTVRLAGAKDTRGGKISATMVSCDPNKVHIGMLVELVFRRCGMELGLAKYGYKVKPV